jgi:hypothetical protein
MTPSPADRPEPPAAPQPAARPTAPTPPILANPSMRLDSGLNMVVLEFYDQQGELRAKIPSERELRAYQQGQDPTMPGAPAQRREFA